MLGRRKETKGDAETTGKAPDLSSDGGQATAPKDAKAPSVHRRLGDFLLAEGVVGAEQLAEARALQKEHGGFLGHILVQLGHVKQETIASCLVKQCKIPHLSLLDYDIGPAVVQLIPEDVCRRHNLIPIDKLGRILTVAMVDPLDLEALEAVREVCPDLRIKPILCNWEHYDLVSGRAFAKTDSAKDDSTLSIQSLGLAAKSPKKRKLPEETAKHPQLDVKTEAGPADAAPGIQPVGGAEMAAALREMQVAVSASIREAFAALPQVDATSPPPPTGAELAALMRDSVGAAVQEAMETVVQELRGQSSPAVAPVESAALLGAVREGLSQTIQEALAGIAERLPAESAPVSSVSPEDLVAAVREGVASALPELKVAVAPDAGEDLAAAVREGVASAVQELSAAAPQASSGDLALAVREGVAEAVQEALQAMDARPPAEAAPPADPPVSAESLAEAVREGVSGAVKELTAAAPQASSEDLAHAVREGVSGAMKELTAAVAEQLRGVADGKEGRAGEAMAASIARMQESIVLAVRETAAASSDAQAGQSAKLAQIAEAALQSMQQTSQLVESNLVADGERRDLSAGRRTRHASVAPFGEEGEAEALTEEDEQVLDALDSEQPLVTLTFENFFPGETNAFTAKLGEAVSNKPGGEYNPFFLYGCVGVGKTHLISAIGNAIRAREEKLRVGYVSASHFASRVMGAIKEDALGAFRENYCHWDVLILDDIQFMGGRVEAQEEFFHIFNVLHQQQRQIIIAGDKAPDRLGLLEQRLVSRFASGIVAELKAPEWETRMKILRNQAKQAKAKVPEEVLSLVAMRVPNDVRKMTGSLRKIVAFSQLVGQKMSCEMADEILSHLGAGEAA